MMRRLGLVLLIACSSKRGGTTGGGNVPPATSCDDAKPKVEQLYRAESTANHDKPERTTEAIADNTAMVMSECVKSPDKVVACINRVATATELEQQCLAPLDDEGTEGEALRK